MYIIINILEPYANMGSQLWQQKISLFIYRWVQNYKKENWYNAFENTFRKKGTVHILKCSIS